MKTNMKRMTAKEAREPENGLESVQFPAGRLPAVRREDSDHLAHKGLQFIEREVRIVEMCELLENQLNYRSLVMEWRKAIYAKRIDSRHYVFLVAVHEAVN